MCPEGLLFLVEHPMHEKGLLKSLVVVRVRATVVVQRNNQSVSLILKRGAWD